MQLHHDRGQKGAAGTLFLGGRLGLRQTHGRLSVEDACGVLCASLTVRGTGWCSSITQNSRRGPQPQEDEEVAPTSHGRARSIPAPRWRQAILRTVRTVRSSATR
jgi:hypothetical protein